jgi:hypothetical protein
MGAKRHGKLPDSLGKIMSEVAREDGLFELAKLYHPEPSEPQRKEIMLGGYALKRRTRWQDASG